MVESRRWVHQLFVHALVMRVCARLRYRGWSHSHSQSARAKRQQKIEMDGNEISFSWCVMMGGRLGSYWTGVCLGVKLVRPSRWLYAGVW